MSAWTPIADTAPAPTLGIDEAAAVEEVLETARAWANGELTTDQALTLATDTPRAIGLAFRHAWRDRRRPALERLHMLEYGRRYHLTYTAFGWLPTHVFEQIQRQNVWRRAHDDWAA